MDIRKKILITGASGFVGSHLVAWLQCKYEVVTPVVRYVADQKFDFSGIFAIIHLAGKAHDTRNVLVENEYMEANYELTRLVYDHFLQDKRADCFIFVSSVKAVADTAGDEVITEETNATVTSVYGQSKRKAEEYILSNLPTGSKRVYILRPCMIHGPGNKGNLNLLYTVVSKGVPWPLGAFDNKRSFCGIDNFCFVTQELMEGTNIPSGVYNLSDDTPVSTNELIRIIAESKMKRPWILHIPKRLVGAVARIGDYLSLPLNSTRLQKLTESYIVSNKKLMNAIGKKLPFSSHESLKKTILSFKNAE